MRLTTRLKMVLNVMVAAAVTRLMLFNPYSLTSNFGMEGDHIKGDQVRQDVAVEETSAFKGFFEIASTASEDSPRTSMLFESKNRVPKTEQNMSSLLLLDNQQVNKNNRMIDEEVNATANGLNENFTKYTSQSPDLSETRNSTAFTEGVPNSIKLSKRIAEHISGTSRYDDIAVRTSQNLTRDDLFMNNYFYRVWMGDENGFPSADGIKPLQVMKTYIRQHSQQQLEHEWDDCQKRNHCDAIRNRKFVVGMYSCPVESGNRLHRFMNGLLWSILTNRTFLARYDTVETCQEYGETKEKCTILHEQSQESLCKEVLHLSPWVPNFNQWNETLALPAIVRAEIPFKGNPDNATQPYDNPMNPVVIRTGFQISPDKTQIFRKNRYAKSYLNQTSNLQRLKMMSGLGPYFFYGMMFESLFTVDPSLIPPQKQPSQIDNETEVETFFLHSRHPKSSSAMDAYTWPEELCLMKFQNATKKPCLYYLMSDREKTLELLTDIIQNKTRCSVEKVSNRSLSNSFSVEHGPFSGKGYWEDVSMAIQARHGMIAFHMHRRDLVRTSTAIVREIIEFRRVLENGRNVLPRFRECRNPWRNE